MPSTRFACRILLALLLLQAGGCSLFKSDPQEQIESGPPPSKDAAPSRSPTEIIEPKNIPPRKSLIRSDEHAAQAKLAQVPFNQAIDLMKNGDLDDAFRQFRDIALNYPELAGPVVNQAIILRKQGKVEDAYDLLQESSGRINDNPFLFNELGLVCRKLGKFKQSKASYQSAIKIDNRFPDAHYNLAILADLYLHQPDLALQEFQVYQTLISTPDKTVAGWIKELERRAKQN